MLTFLLFLCGALGVLGAILLALFLIGEMGSAYQQGRTPDWGPTVGIYGCAMAVTGPLIAAGAAVIPGVGWRALLAFPGVFVLLTVLRTIARGLGSTRGAALRHARSTDPAVRALGVAKLVAVGDPTKDREVRQALEDALQSGEPAILKMSAAALYRLGFKDVVAQALAQPFKDPQRGFRESYAVGAVLRELGAEAAGPVLRSLESTGTPPSCRRAIISALYDVRGDDVTRAVRKALGDPEPQVRAGAVEWVGRYDPTGAREGLLPALQDSSASVRLVAIQALGELGEPRVAGPALLALKEPEEEHCRQAIAALGKVRAAEAVEPLLAMLDDPRPLLRAEAAEALGRIGDRRAVDRLVPTLRTDPLYRTRARAVAALESLGWAPSSPPEQVAHALARGTWDHPFEPDEETLNGFQCALKEPDAAEGALVRLERLLREKPAQVSDAWLWTFSQQEHPQGPEMDRREPNFLDANPLRKAARAEIARRAVTR